MFPRAAVLADPVAKDARREVIYEADETNKRPIHPSVSTNLLNFMNNISKCIFLFLY